MALAVKQHMSFSPIRTPDKFVTISKQNFYLVKLCHKIHSQFVLIEQFFQVFVEDGYNGKFPVLFSNFILKRPP